VSELIHFSAWRDDQPAPETCSLCQTSEPIFEYQMSARPGDQDPATKGYCCLRCAQQLLASLEELTLARWAAEFPALKTEKTIE
jgi:hypothetical protein